MNILLHAFKLLFLITVTRQSPHIFSEKETCEITAKVGKKIEKYSVPARINAENEDLKVSVVLCTKNDFVPGGQSNYSKVSVYDKTSLKTQNNHDNQPYEVLKEKENVIISLPDNIKCTDHLNYTITIKLMHEYTKKPRLNADTECEVEIVTTHPRYNPPCRRFIDGKWFIDLTPLKRKTFHVGNNKGDSFNVCLCGPASGCEKEAGCKISGNETTTIGSLNDQEVKFDSSMNTVSVFSSIKDGRRKKTMSVYLRCNWDVPYIANAKLLNEGSNFKFEVQSSLGCVKMPQTCIFRDTGHYLTYDLRSLSNKDGTIVRNTTKNIRLNVCGDLQMKVGNNRCHTQKSQVCETQGSVYINRGSIPHFEVSEGKIRAVFRDGHQCNVNETYNTIVDLICSPIDEGPIFVAQNDCSTEILWKTPRACPKFEINTKSCIFHSSYGNVNLTELFVDDGRTEQLSRNRKLVYNICGNLNFNCSTSNQVSACILDGNKQKIIGWNEPNLMYTNGKLQLKYTGEKCRNKNQPYSLTINMICNYLEKRYIPVLKEVDDCTFEVTVISTSACLKHWEVKNCTIEGENYKYDLSPLRQGVRNYEIVDSVNRNRRYYFNLCAPVVNRENLLFHPNSMMSMGDLSAAVITERFPSLGKVTEPVVQNGELFVKLTGVYCKERGVYYSAKIIFECSDNEESQTIVNNNGCSLELRWRTRHACPTMKKGGKCSLTDENDSVKVPGDPIEVVMYSFNTYYFSLCLEYYQRCTRNNSCVTKKLSKRIQDGNLQLTLDDSDRLKTVNLTVHCDPYTFLSTSKGPVNDPQHLDLQVKTRISCNMDSRKIGRAVEPRSEHEYKIDEKNDESLAENKPKTENTEIPKKIEVSEVPHLSEMTSKESPHETKKVDVSPVLHSSESTSKESPHEIKHDEIFHPVEEHLNNIKININNLTPVIPKQGCKVIKVNGNTLLLKDLTSKEFKSSNATYVINFDGNSSKCGGLFCRNGGNILNFIEDCPEITYGEDYVSLSYSKSESGEVHYPVSENSSVNSVHKKVQIVLKCTHDDITARTSETNSEITVHYSSPKICIFAQSSNLLFVFVCIGLVVICSLCLTAFVIYRKKVCMKSYTRVSEESGLIIHSKLL